MVSGIGQNDGGAHLTLPLMSNSHCVTGAGTFTHDALAHEVYGCRHDILSQCGGRTVHEDTEEAPSNKRADGIKPQAGNIPISTRL